MPPLPYSQGVPSVEPQVSVPDNYLRIQSTPAEFGGLIGQGEQALGQGALKAHQFYSEVAADAATNQYMEGARKVIYGDPDKPWLDATGNPILDNDGKPQPDRGLIGLQGDQAMRAGPQKIKELDDLRKRLGAGLLTGDSQLKFDAETRRMQSYHNTQIGAHIENEAQKWAGEVEKARVYNHKIALGQAVLAGDQPEIDRHTQDIIGAHVAQASRLGGGNELLNQAVNLGKAEAAETSIEALMPTDPKKARALLEANRSVLAGVGKYDALDARTKSHALRSDVNELVTGARNAVVSGGAGTAKLGEVIPYTPAGDNFLATSGIYDTFRSHIAARESGSYAEPPNKEGYMGRYQMGSGEIKEAAQRLGIATPTQQQFLADPQLQERLFENYTIWQDQQMTAHSPRYAAASPSEKAAFLAGAHLTGWKNMSDFLAGGKEYHDSNNTTPSDYVRSMRNALGQGGGAPPQNAQTPGVQPAQAPGTPPAATPIPSSVPDTGTVPLAPQQASSLSTALAHIYQSDKSDEAKELAANRIEHQYRAAEADESRASAREARRVKQFSESAENEYIAADSKLTAAQASVDPRLTPEAKMRMIGYINRADKPDPLTRVSQQTTTHILEDMRRDAGDPKRIEDTGPIYDAFIHSQLSRADFDFLTKQFADIRSPQGEKMAVRQKEFMSGIKPLITKSNPLMGAQDPIGDPMYYMYQWTVDHKIDDYRKAGKDPFDLFDPTKPDYVGSPAFLKPFQTSFQQSMRQKAGSVSGAPVPPAYPEAPTAAPAIIPRTPGESPADYLKRIGSPVAPAPAAAPPSPAAPTIAPPIR